MPRAGRELEKLAAKIESIIAGTNIGIKSPDYIRGVISRSKREVDVSLRAEVGSSSVLIILESRDRQKKQDLTWIEQLVTKKQDVQVDRVIAVSSSPFSQGAVNLAEHFGIELRSLESLTSDVISSWFGPKEIDVLQCSWVLKSLVFETDGSIDESAKSWLAKVVSDPHIPCMFHEKTGAVRSVLQVWQSVLNQNPQLTSNLSPNVLAELANRGHSKEYHLCVTFPKTEERYSLYEIENPVYISQMKIVAELVVEQLESPIPQITQYVDGRKNAVIAQSVRYLIATSKGEIEVSFHNLGNDDQSLVVVESVNS